MNPRRHEAGERGRDRLDAQFAHAGQQLLLQCDGLLEVGGRQRAAVLVHVAHAVPGQEGGAGEEVGQLGVGQAELLPDAGPDGLPAQRGHGQVKAVQGHHIEVALPLRPAVVGGGVAGRADVVLHQVAEGGDYPFVRVVGPAGGQVQLAAAPGEQGQVVRAQVGVGAAAERHAAAAADSDGAVGGGDLEHGAAGLRGDGLQAELGRARAEAADEHVAGRGGGVRGQGGGRDQGGLAQGDDGERNTHRNSPAGPPLAPPAHGGAGTGRYLVNSFRFTRTLALRP